MTDTKFKVGDKVAYPGQGVAEVVGITEKSLAGQVIIFFDLRMMETDIRIMVPVHKAEQVGLRPLVSDPEIAHIMHILSQRNVVFDKQAWNRRYRGFVEKIKTGSLFDVAEVYRDLSLLKHKKVLSFGEKRMLETARSLLVKEIAVVKQHKEETIESELEAMFAQP